MSLLLTQVAQRLVGKGGEPVIQLQTAFGGGKTHTMLAVYHLTTRKCALSDLAGVSALVDRAGLMDVPQARVAVLDGTARSPGQAWKRGQQTIKTLWGELAWQLGGEAAGALVGDADATGTSPGKPELGPAIAKPRAFHASAEVPTSTAKMRFVQIADEIVSVLTSDPNALVRLVVEISAEFPEGASDTVKRAVSENARSLELKNAAWAVSYTHLTLPTILRV